MGFVFCPVVTGYFSTMNSKIRKFDSTNMRLSLNLFSTTTDDISVNEPSVNYSPETVKQISPSNSNIWSTYKKSLTTSPLLAKSIASAIGFGTADILAQLFLTKVNAFDVLRFLRFSAFGAFFHGPSGHIFYRWINRKFPGSTPTAVTKKILIDQIIWNPIFSFVLYLFTGVIGGATPNFILSKMKRNIGIAVLGSWFIWPLGHLINFKFVPAQYRLMYMNFVQLAYNVLLSVLVGEWPKYHY